MQACGSAFFIVVKNLGDLRDFFVLFASKIKRTQRAAEGPNRSLNSSFAFFYVPSCTYPFNFCCVTHLYAINLTLHLQQPRTIAEQTLKCATQPKLNSCSYAGHTQHQLQSKNYSLNKICWS